ncbi:hypothetical protein [Pseudobutyrivibrio sp.]|uniref:hypothetical protein n=1 Tax=Pseudobutyrivibrio sp. TaxID=2014367 RepID=UPI00386FC758
MKENTNKFLNKKCLLKKAAAVSVAAVTVLAAVFSTTLTANAEEAQVFIPFRSDFINYLSEHSTDKNSDENIYIFARTIGEMYSNGNWTATYHAETVLPGGTYLSDSAAASHPLYKNGVADPVYDQMIANLIEANGATFLNSWIKGYTAKGVTYLTAAAGSDSFIKSFDNEHASFGQTSEAIIAYTQTAEGRNWLNQYSYANTGNNEATVGVTLLKLLCDDWESLDDNQTAWCKAYLPFLLSNYASQGNNAITASTKNAYLYDFMARSVNGAQYTGTKAVASTVSANGVSLGTVGAGVSLQQEFFNYVVASNTGFGEFVQNIIGGGKYTGAYSNSYDVSSYETVSSMFYGSNNSNINYYTSTANGGDRDTDWFVHAMYLYSKGSGYTNFSTIYKLTQNNSTALTWYNKWLSRFHGKSGQTESWGYLSNQTTNVTNTYRNTSGGHSPLSVGSFMWFGWKNGDSTGYLYDDPGAVTGYSYSSQLLAGLNFGRSGRGCLYAEGWLNETDATFTYYTPLNQDYAGANTVTVTFGGGSYDYESGAVTVRLISSSGTIISSASGTTSVTLSISENAWNTYKNIYLQVYVPYTTIKTMGETRWSRSGQGLSNSFGLAVTGVTLSWSSSQTCINGHNWGSWTYNYSDDYSTCKVSHVCSTCGVDECETITATKTLTSTAYKYTYTPSTLSSSLSAWTKTVSRDLGSGTATFTSSSGSSYVSGTWSVTNNQYSITYGHAYYSGTWYTVTESVSHAYGTAALNKNTIKANAKSVTVTAAYSDDSITATLYNQSGTELIKVSGTNSVRLNLSDLSNEDKTNCYLVIYHNRTCTASNKKATTNWNSYPSAPSVSSTSAISKVTVTY